MNTHPCCNTPTRTEIPKHRCNPLVAEVANPQNKRGRPQESKDKVSRKKRTPRLVETIPARKNELMVISSPLLETPEELNSVETEISLNYVRTRKVFDPKNILDDNQFTYHVTNYCAINDNNDENIDPHSVAECKRRVDWSM